MKTLEQRQQDLKAQYERELKGIELTEEIWLKVGTVAIYSDTTHSLIFQTAQKYVYPKGITSTKQIRDIMRVHPPSKENAKLTFATKDPIETKSPFLLKVHGYTHRKEGEASFEYKTKDGLGIKINLKEPLVAFASEYRMLDPNSRAKNPETFKDFWLNTGQGFSIQTYATSSRAITRYYHGIKEQFISLFKEDREFQI